MGHSDDEPNVDVRLFDGGSAVPDRGGSAAELSAGVLQSDPAERRDAIFIPDAASPTTCLLFLQRRRFSCLLAQYEVFCVCRALGRGRGPRGPLSPAGAGKPHPPPLACILHINTSPLTDDAARHPQRVHRADPAQRAQGRHARQRRRLQPRKVSPLGDGQRHLQHAVRCLTCCPEVVADGNSEFVLKRDGTDVKVNDACAATSGTWKSPYDDGTWTQASDVDIDHMVPLKNAWIVSVSIIPLPMACRLTPAVGRLGVDHGAAQGLRQRHHAAAALGRHGQRQPGQERPEPRRVEAAPDELLLHLRQELGPGQELLQADHYRRREGRAVGHAGQVLSGFTSCTYCGRTCAG